jgi:hypothetical protein
VMVVVAWKFVQRCQEEASSRVPQSEGKINRRKKRTAGSPLQNPPFEMTGSG